MARKSQLFLSILNLDILTKFSPVNRYRLTVAFVILISGISGASFMFTPYMGDEVWAVYLFGTQYMNDPSLLFTRPINEISTWMGFGNFRPLGRFFEHLGYAATIFFSDLTNTPPASVYAVIRLVLYVLFILSIFSFVVQFLRNDEFVPLQAGFFVAVIAISLSLVNSASGGLRLFPTFYTFSYILILVSLTLIIRIRFKYNFVTRATIFFVIGFVAASYNELTNLIIPLSLLLCVCISPQERFFKKCTESLTFLFPLLVAFFVIWVPIRFQIWKICARTECYGPSSLNMEASIFPTFIRRISSSLPPFPHLQSNRWTSHIDLGTINLVTCLILAAFVFSSSVKLLRSEYILSHSDATWRNLGVFGLAVIAVTSLTISMSSDLQSNTLLGMSWRETPLYIFGISLVVIWLISSAVRRTSGLRLRKHVTIMLTSLILGVLIFETSFQNYKITKLYNAQLDSSVIPKIEKSLMDNARDANEVDQLCKLLNSDDFYQENVSLALIQGINSYSKLRTGVTIC